MAIARKVLIVGGGIAGQTLGPALIKRGIACRIVEIKPSFDIIGAGMYVQGGTRWGSPRSLRRSQPDQVPRVLSQSLCGMPLAATVTVYAR